LRIDLSSDGIFNFLFKRRNFGGGCQGCSSVKVTLKNGVEAQLKSIYPEINNVLDVTDHSQKENACCGLTSAAMVYLIFSSSGASSLGASPLAFGAVGCQGCSSVKVTLKNGVEAQLKSIYPEINNVLDVTDHSQKENAYMKWMNSVRNIILISECFK
jgi:Fe-S cluster biogenesis protein NfuA